MISINTFTYRVVSDWNSLPDKVVAIGSVSSFECMLDKFWCYQPMRYDWKTELTEIGGRHIMVCQRMQT
jgi:hypothetical protein